ncbi:MAG: PAS domain S-box protein [Nitrospira sp.]|nr:PAS domain S-box protein [Nitrospira sp.]
MASAIQQAFRDGYTELESHLLTKDGRTIPYHWTGAPLKNCHGHIIGLTGVGRDITAWKVMGLQRQEQTERLRLAMDIADLATWYWDISTNTVIWSENFEQVNRLPPGTFDGTFEAYQQLVHPDDLPMLFADINRALAGPDPSHTVHRIVSPRGDIQWIEGNGIVYRNESGQPIRMVGTIHNITARRRAEEALRISEERFALAVEGSTDVLWDVHRIPGKPWHAPETLIWWSPRVRQLLGLEEGESFDTLMQWTARLHPDDVNQVFVRLTAHIEQRVPYDVEYRLRTNHGEYRWVWGRGQAIWNEQGEFCRMSGSCQDMTDRKQAQEALRVSEERFATVFNEAAIGVTLVSMDGHWFEVNQALCQIIGYSKEELQNTTFQSLTYPDDLPKSMLLLEKLLSGDLRTHQMEKRYLHKDGHIVWVNLSASSVRNRDGQVLYLIAQIQDITERKYVEAARETLQYAIDHGMEGFALLDGQGGYTYMNAAHARMYGYEVAELIGQSWKTLYDSDQIATIEAVAFPALQAEGFWRGELTGRLKAGGPVHVEISLQRFPHEGANSEAFLCTCRDTTARKHVEEMLRQRERDLRAAVKERERISEDLHDGILQSIFAVGLGLESCRTFVSKRPSSSKMAATPLMTALNRAIGQLNHVMTDVRNFIAGIDSHMLEDTDVGETVRTMVQAMCASNGTACRVTIEEAAAQELSTEQAYHVMNIVREALSNSLRHSGAVRVTLSLKRLRRSVRLLVTDNGKGFIPEAVRDVGHGLVNMAARARKLGGRIEVRSRPRQGAKVLLDIPRRSADE